MDQTNGQMATQNRRSCGKLLQQTSNILKALPARRQAGGWVGWPSQTCNHWSRWTSCCCRWWSLSWSICKKYMSKCLKHWKSIFSEFFVFGNANPFSRVWAVCIKVEGQIVIFLLPPICTVKGEAGWKDRWKQLVFNLGDIWVIFGCYSGSFLDF